MAKRKESSRETTGSKSAGRKTGQRRKAAPKKSKRKSATGKTAASDIGVTETASSISESETVKAPSAEARSGSPSPAQSAETSRAVVSSDAASKEALSPGPRAPTGHAGAVAKATTSAVNHSGGSHQADSKGVDSFGWNDVLAQELSFIQRRRISQWHEDKDTSSDGPSDAEEPTSDDPSPKAMDANLSGLAISGGGIRSATFALGILQGLAEMKMLRHFDYLSTVSGGGYIGSWLSAWARREGSLQEVERQLIPSKSGRATAGATIVPDSVAPKPIERLRENSNYLSPKLGFFSADSWALVAVYLRDLLAIQLVLLPATLCLLAVVRLIVWAHSPATQHFISTSDYVAPVSFGVTGAAVLLVFFSFGLIATSLWKLRTHRYKPADSQKGTRHPLEMLVLGLLVTASLLLSWVWSDQRHVELMLEKVYESGFLSSLADALGLAALMKRENAPLLFAAFFAALHGPFFIGMSRRRKSLWPVFVGSLVGGIGGGLAFLAMEGFLWPLQKSGHSFAVPAIAPAVLLVVYAIAAKCEVILFENNIGMEEREWWGRFCGHLFQFGLIWLIFAGTAVYGVVAYHWLGEEAGTACGIGWLGTSIIGVLTARSSETTAGAKGLRNWVSVSSPYVFIAGLLSTLSVTIGVVLGDGISESKLTVLVAESTVAVPVSHADIESEEVWKGPGNRTPVDIRPPQIRADAKPVDVSQTRKYRHEVDLIELAARKYRCQVNDTKVGPLSGFLAGMFALTLLTSWYVDINAFSLNGLYANRLTRCYLGASRRKRNPEPFSKFDPKDDIALHKMAIGDTSAIPEDVREDLKTQNKSVDWGPYHVVNAAINLPQGDDLAHQERMADSFTLSPAFCGNRTLGYRRTFTPKPEDSRKPQPLTLGRAVAISGAAASPNMGYHTSTVVAALLTIFNVRLGWWVGNPRKREEWFESPGFAMRPLLSELLALANAHSEFVNLSDGGHFENLAVYELIRRRCRYIIVSDGGADPDLEFEDLGGLVRKCRQDFGVEIEIKVDQIMRDAQTGRSRWRCAIGTIRYDQLDSTFKLGTLVYLKPVIVGDETPDIANYHAQHSDFPHQSTADQFFSESQFESYRKLGYLTATTVLAEAAGKAQKAIDEPTSDLPGGNHADPPPIDEVNRVHSKVLSEFFETLRRRWLNPPPDLKEKFEETLDEFLDIQKQMREFERTSSISRELYPEFRRHWDMSVAGVEAIDQKLAASGSSSIHLASQMLQVMENTWLALNLSDYHGHPLNRGWMNVFRRWTSTSMMRRYWPVLRGEYSRGFVDFCQTELPMRVEYSDWREVKTRRRGKTRAISDRKFGILDDQYQLEQAGLQFPRLVTTTGEQLKRNPRPESLETVYGNAIVSQRGNRLFSLQEVGPAEPLHWEGPGRKPRDFDTGHVVCGCFATLPDPSPSAAAEVVQLFLWVRSSHRQLGVGHHMLAQAIDAFEREGEPKRVIRFWYPLSVKPAASSGVMADGPTRKGEQMHRQWWQAFLNHYDFRISQDSAPVDADDGWLIMERPIDPAPADNAGK